jgi:hypothetical protein
LRDPDLAAAAFKSAPEFRAEVIEVGRPPSLLAPRFQMSRGWRSIAFKDRDFGPSLIRVLTNPARRDKLFQRMTKASKSRQKAYRFLAEGYYENVRAEYGAILPELMTVCIKRDDLWYLAAGKYAAWLSRQVIPTESRRPLALFTCAFAILQPREAPELLQTLLDRDSAFRYWLGENEPVAPLTPGLLHAEPTPAIAIAASGTSAPAAEQPRTVAPTPPPLPSPTVSLMTASSEKSSATSGIQDGLTAHETQQLLAIIDILRTAAASETCQPVDTKLLEKAAARLRPSMLPGVARLAQLDSQLAVLRKERVQTANELADSLANVAVELRTEIAAHEASVQRVQALLKEVQAMPWWKAVPTIEPVLSALNSSPMSQAGTARLELLLRRLSEAHTVLLTLVDRLGARPPAFLPAGIEFASAADMLERYVTEYRARLDAIGQREQIVGSLLTLLEGADDDNAARLLEEVEPPRWVEVLLFLNGPTAYTESGKPYAALIGRDDLMAIILGYLWHKDAALALAATPTVIGAAPRVSRLAFLDYAQLNALAQAEPTLAPAMAEALCMAVFRANDPTMLEYLEPIVECTTIPMGVRRFYQALITAKRRGLLVDSLDQLRALEQRSSPTNRSPDPDDPRRLLLQAIDNPPGMRKTFHRLRVLAQMRFLKPLRPDIDARRADDVWEAWQQQGNLDEMVQECVRASGLDREIDDVHVVKTRQYLQDFERNLDLWRRLLRPMPSGVHQLLQPALTSLRCEAEAKVNGSSARSLLESLGRLMRANATGDSELSPSDFGQRCTVTEAAELVLLNPFPHIDERMTASYPRAVASERVPVACLLADLLRRALGRGPADRAAAVELYLSRGDLDAAQAAANGHPDLEVEVAHWTEARRSEFREKNEALIAESRTASELDGNVRDCLAEVETRLAEADFIEASEWLAELDELMRRFRALHDPRRQALVAFLREAAEAVPETALADDLGRLADDLRLRNAARRQHLSELERVKATTGFPPELAEKWAALARHLDRPACWLDEERSLQLALALEVYRLKVPRKLKWENIDPGARALVERLVGWVADRLQAGIGDGNADALGAITSLAEELADDCPDERILQVLGAPSVPTAGTPPPKPHTATLPAAEAFDATAANGAPDSSKLVAEIRAALREKAEQERAISADERRLREASMKFSWVDMRQLAAAMIRGPSPVSPDRIREVEAVYAVALAGGSRDDESAAAAFTRACAAVLSAERSDCLHYFSQEFLDDLPARTVLVLTGTDRTSALGEGSQLAARLAESLARAVSLASSDEAFRRIADLMLKGGRRLAGQLWETLRGLKSQAEARGDLLILLYRQHHWDALQRLSEHFRPLDDLVRDCLKASEQAEIDPTIRSRASEIFVALRQQIEGKRNSGPWVRLFYWIERNRSRSEGDAVECELLSEYFSPAADAKYNLQFRLAPSSTDPPRELQVELTAAGCEPHRLVLLEDEPLLKERVISLDVPTGFVLQTGSDAEVAYRLTGRTIFQNPIDLRNTWRRPVFRQPAFHLSDAEIRENWPGHSGNPVGRAGFRGRESVCRQIEEKCLRHPSRQGSVMLFGQRRIGKTSLLLRMVESWQPQHGRVCGAFFDVSGRTLAPGNMNKGFFDALVGVLSNGQENAALRTALGGQSVSALARDLHPELSLAESLEELVVRLRNASGGKIDRLAVFIDEFDTFVKPMLLNQREEVERLQWNLRQIVQRSRLLSLVLAGTGLQRMFIEDYKNPFYGSIDAIEVEPFAPETEKAAIADVFLPAPLRGRLCPDARRFDDVLAMANELSGGHPWFLSMLGYAAARLSGGHRLTPILLRRTAEVMMQGQIPGGGKANQRSNFYSYDFLSLERLPERRQACAKALLATIAQRTSRESPWLLRWVALEHPGLAQRTSEELRQEALKALLDERLLELDSRRSKVRIRVLLTAEAIRRDASEILERAFSQLRPDRSDGP